MKRLDLDAFLGAVALVALAHTLDVHPFVPVVVLLAVVLLPTPPTMPTLPTREVHRR